MFGEYVAMARSPSKPANLTLVEFNPAFHPDDKEAVHGGVTAFPGLSRHEKNLRSHPPSKILTGRPTISI